jgi:hypothetical protein
VTRGFAWGYYVSDDGNTYALQVDADYLAMAERGWTGPAIAGTIVYPRGWTPRRVIGLDDRGKLQQAVVASTSADLWTGVASTFTINGTDELPHTCNVIARKSERNQVRP